MKKTTIALLCLLSCGKLLAARISAHNAGAGGGGAGDIEGVTAGYGLTGGGTSGTVTLNLDGNTTSYIQNRDTLQSGTTFYVSSGTINTQLRIASLNCTGNTNGGSLTTDANGIISCSDDDSGGGGGAIVVQDSGVQVDVAVGTISVNGVLKSTQTSSGIVNIYHNYDTTFFQDNNSTFTFVANSITASEMAADSVGASELADNSAVAANMANSDHGDVSWTSNVATVENVQCSDCVALTSETSGIYVSSINVTAPITVTSNGTEGSSPTIALTQNAGTDVTADLEEESHASEHQDGGADEISVTSLSGLLADPQNIVVSTAGVFVASTTRVNFEAGANASVSATVHPSSITVTYAATGGGGSSVSSFTYTFNPDQAKLPGSNPCVISNSTSSVTSSLLCDASTDESVTWSTTLNPFNSGTLKADLYYTMVSASSNSVVLTGEIMCVTSGDSADLDTESFAAAGSVTDTVPGTAGYLDKATVTPTNDACAIGDLIVLRITRDANNGSDDAIGDVEIRKVRLYEE